MSGKEFPSASQGLAARSHKEKYINEEKEKLASQSRMYFPFPGSIGIVKRSRVVGMLILLHVKVVECIQELVVSISSFEVGLR